MTTRPVPRHRGNPRCARDGHRWRRRTRDVDVCRRRHCDAIRTNPEALPPWDPASPQYEEWTRT